MKRALLQVIERARADLLDALIAVERDDVDAAVAKFDEIAEALRGQAEELRVESGRPEAVA